MAGRYRIDRVAPEFVASRAAVWTFARRPVAGTEHTYNVTDGNFRDRNQFEFVVRVPKSAANRIEIRPLKTPNVAIYAGLERRSLTFNRANRPGYRGRVYCPVALADPTGDKSRTLVTDRAFLPRWFDQFEARLRKKPTVASTRGTDGDTFVLFCDGDDHAFMIRAFFAAKVWVLRDST